jgi:hypothetical protein
MQTTNSLNINKSRKLNLVSDFFTVYLILLVVSGLLNLMQVFSVKLIFSSSLVELQNNLKTASVIIFLSDLLYYGLIITVSFLISRSLIKKYKEYGNKIFLYIMFPSVISGFILTVSNILKLFLIYFVIPKEISWVIASFIPYMKVITSDGVFVSMTFYNLLILFYWSFVVCAISEISLLIMKYRRNEETNIEPVPSNVFVHNPPLGNVPSGNISNVPVSIKVKEQSYSDNNPSL